MKNDTRCTCQDDAYCASGTSPTSIVPLSYPGLCAAYGMGDHYLPIVALDERQRPLALTKAGKLVVATRTRVEGETFEGVVVR